MPGAVAFNFDRKGIISVDRASCNEDQLFSAVTEAGAHDFETAKDVYIITTDVSDLYAIKEVVEKAGGKVEEAGLDMIPKNYIDCSEEAMKDNLALVEWLDNIDDVDAVYHNMNMPEENS